MWNNSTGMKPCEQLPCFPAFNLTQCVVMRPEETKIYKASKNIDQSSVHMKSLCHNDFKTEPFSKTFMRIIRCNLFWNARFKLAKLLNSLMKKS